MCLGMFNLLRLSFQSFDLKKNCAAHRKNLIKSCDRNRSPLLWFKILQRPNIAAFHKVHLDVLDPCGLELPTNSAK